MTFRQFLESLYPDNTYVLLIGRSVNKLHKADEEDIFDASASIRTEYTKTFFTEFNKAIKAFHDIMFETKEQYDIKSKAIPEEDKTLVTSNNVGGDSIVHVSLSWSYASKQSNIAWWNKSSNKVFFGTILDDKPKVKAYLQMPHIRIPNTVHSYKKWKQDMEQQHGNLNTTIHKDNL